jgi:DnaJ-class molecular chaperone
MACPICKGTKVVECSKCKGSGTVIGIIGTNKCSHCKGTGKVKCSCA